MNIALFASAFYPSLGGVEELVRQLAHEQQSVGDQPLVLVNRWPRSLPRREQVEGIPVRRLAMRVPDGSLKAHVVYRATHSAIRREMIAVLREARSEILHVQCVSSNGFYALEASRALGLPLIVTLQGELTMDASGLYQRSAFARAVLREVLQAADAITACSQQTLQEAEAFYDAPFGARGHTIYNGVKLSEFHDAAPYFHPRPYILAIGRHVPQKGFDLLLQAFALAVHQGGGTHDLLIAGCGSETQALERLAGNLDLGDRVQFLGRADRAMAVSLFLACSFFVLPSRHEPLGIVNLEAMAAGKAVIASHVGGVPEIVADGETGLVVPPQDIDELSAAIRRLIQDVALRDRLGQAGARRARRFDWPAVAEQYHQVYSTAIQGRAESKWPEKG